MKEYPKETFDEKFYQQLKQKGYLDET